MLSHANGIKEKKLNKQTKHVVDIWRLKAFTTVLLILCIVVGRWNLEDRKKRADEDRELKKAF